MTTVFHVPELGEGLYEAELVAWKVREGDVVRPGQALAEVLTDKASADLPSPFHGTIVRRLAEEGSTIEVGQGLIEYEPAGSNTAEAADERSSSAATASADRLDAPAPPTSSGNSPPGNETARTAHHPPGPSPVRASPAVRRLAREAGLDLTRLAGSGRGGRILMRDLVAAMEARSPRPAANAPASSATQPTLQLDLGMAGQQVPLRGLRRKIAQHMVAAKQAIPHYSLIDECDVTELVRLQGELEPIARQRGVKLTYLAFWVRAVVESLKEVPLANATYDQANELVTLHDHYHIGIATATPKGLVVPVVRDAQRMSLFELADAIRSVVAAARQQRAKPDDLRGSTFTVTSIGNLGGLASTPIINAPEVAIMGVGRIVDRPRFDAKGEIQRASVVYLSFSFDHRIVDGAVGAVLAQAVKKRLESPATLLLHE